MIKKKELLIEGNTYHQCSNCGAFSEAQFRVCQFCGKGTLKAVVARRASSNQQIEVEEKK